MAMTFQDFVKFLDDEKAQVLVWGKTEAQKLKSQYAAGDFRQDLAQVWIDYYDTLIDLTDEITRKDDNGNYVHDSSAVVSALEAENRIIGDRVMADSLIYELIQLLQGGPPSSLRRHYGSLIWTLRTERRSNTFIIEELR